MRYIGYDCGCFRLPYGPLTEAEYAAYAAKLDQLGILQRAPWTCVRPRES